MTTAPPFFSILVPTRERADTLRSCLATLVAQDYEYFEVVVSDNASADDTRAVVESFRDTRLRYVNTGRRVSITGNWEFALSNARSGYITVIGDDDGLLPNALRDAAGLLSQENVPALAWKKLNYCWPSHPEPAYRNLVLIPVANKLFRCDARRVVRDCVNFWTPYYYLPCVYNSFVHLDIFKRVMARSGAFFHSVTPDAYSGFALASAMSEYRFMTRPLSVNGASGHSSGAGTERFLQGVDGPVAQFLAEIDVPLHPKLPVIVVGSLIASILEAILQANDHCYGGNLRIDFRRSIRLILREAAPSSGERYEAIVRVLREIGARTGECEVIESAIRKYPPLPASPGAPERGLSGDVLTLDTSELGVSDVEGAARVSAAILGTYRRPPVVRQYRSMAKVASRGFRLMQQRLDSWVWE